MARQAPTNLPPLQYVSVPIRSDSWHDATKESLYCSYPCIKVVLHLLRCDQSSQEPGVTILDLPLETLIYRGATTMPRNVITSALRQSAQSAGARLLRSLKNQQTSSLAPFALQTVSPGHPLKPQTSVQGKLVYGSSSPGGAACWYSGEWCNDQREGEGTFSFSSGGVYRGQWKADRRHGRGTMVWPRKETKGPPALSLGAACVVSPPATLIYRGEWRDGLPHGR
jgi:hypothetical protein